MSRPLALVSLTAFALMLGLGVLFPVLPFYVRWLGLSEAQAGVLMSSYAAMSVLTSPLWGRFSQRFGRKPAIVIGLGGFSLGFGLFGLGSSFGELLAARVLGGLFAAAALPAIFAYAADVSRAERRAAAMGTVGAAIGLGVLTGPVIGGLLAPLGLRVPFLTSSGIGLVAALAVVAWLPESRGGEAVQPTRSSRVARRIAPFLAVAFLLQTARMALESTVGFLAEDRLGARPMDVGILLGAIGVVSVLVQGGIRPLSARVGDRLLLLVGIPIGAVGLGGFSAAASWPALYASGIALGLGFALILPTLNAILSRAVEDVQGQAQGLKSGAESLGRVVGPLVFTTAYQVVGPPPVFATAAVLCLLAWLVARFGLARHA